MTPGWGKSPEVGQPTPVFLPGGFHGQRSLVGYIQSRGSESQTRLSTHARAHAHERKFAPFPLPSSFRLECRHSSIIDGHEPEQTLGDSEGQGSLACCSPSGCKESDTTATIQKHSILCSVYRVPGGDANLENSCSNSRYHPEEAAGWQRDGNLSPLTSFNQPVSG